MKQCPERDLEGNTSANPTTSELSNSSLHDLSKKMRVKVDNESSNPFDLLKEIETVRNNLYAKQQQNKSNVEIVEIQDNREESAATVPQLEWLSEESSDLEDFTLVMSRKRKKKRGGKISESPQGIGEATIIRKLLSCQKRKEKRKNHEYTRYSVEL